MPAHDPRPLLQIGLATFTIRQAVWSSLPTRLSAARSPKLSQTDVRQNPRHELWPRSTRRRLQHCSAGYSPQSEHQGNPSDPSPKRSTAALSAYPLQRCRRCSQDRRCGETWYAPRNHHLALPKSRKQTSHETDRIYLTDLVLKR